MYKLWIVAACCFLSFAVLASELQVLAPEALKAKVVEITEAQNKVMFKGSTPADVDKLFALYSNDFVYRHEVYGGDYQKDTLYNNTLRLQAMGKYNNTEPRYRILTLIPGHNAIAVERQEKHKGELKNHLAVFEFQGDKVSKITEYWK